MFISFIEFEFEFYVNFSHLLRLGIDLGDIKQLLHVYPLQNREYVNTNDGKLTLRKNWSKIPLAIAPISVVRNIKIYQKELERFKPIESVFTKGSVVFLMTKDYYGCEATISDSNIRSGRIKSKFKVIFCRISPIQILLNMIFSFQFQL